MPVCQPLARTSRELIQFVTHHQYASGQMHLHAMTFVRSFVERNSPTVGWSSDQDGAAATARLAMFKAGLEESTGRAALARPHVCVTLACLRLKHDRSRASESPPTSGMRARL